MPPGRGPRSSSSKGTGASAGLGMREQNANHQANVGPGCSDVDRAAAPGGHFSPERWTGGCGAKALATRARPGGLGKPADLRQGRPERPETQANPCASFSQAWPSSSSSRWTATLVAPYLIDWNSQRGFIEARLSEVLGQKVTIGGAIDVKLLPTPYLVLGQTVIGDDESPVRLSIHHLDLELSTTPLLHGEINVTQARLVEPTIRVTLAQDRTLPALPDAPRLPRRRLARPHQRHRRHAGDRRSAVGAHLRAGKPEPRGRCRLAFPGRSRSPVSRARAGIRRASGCRRRRRTTGAPMCGWSWAAMPSTPGSISTELWPCPPPTARTCARASMDASSSPASSTRAPARLWPGR